MAKYNNGLSHDRGPSLIVKYVWVINTIRNRRKISFKDLNALWVRDTDISCGVDLPKRTFNNWRYEIWDLFHINIENEKHGEYRYFIENENALNSDKVSSWLYDCFSVSNALINSKSIQHRILLEDIPSGQQFLQPIIDAMKENRTMYMVYQLYWKDEECDMEVEPYCVKLFRRRWYMIGQPNYADHPHIYSLDRIVQLERTDTTFTLPEDWSAQEYFNGCFGIIADHHTKIEKVKLKVSAGQANYLRDLPLHESQDEEQYINDEYSIFTLDVRPTYDFIQEILWNAEDVEILEPLDLRKEMKEKLMRMSSKYKTIKPNNSSSKQGRKR